MKKKTLIGIVGSVLVALTGTAVLTIGKPEGKNLEKVLIADANIPKIERKLDPLFDYGMPLRKDKGLGKDGGEKNQPQINFSEENSNTDKYGRLITTTTNFYGDGKTPKKISKKIEEAEKCHLEEIFLREDETPKRITYDDNCDGTLDSQGDYDKLGRLVWSEEIREGLSGFTTNTREIEYYGNTKNQKSINENKTSEDGGHIWRREFSNEGKKIYEDYESDMEKAVTGWEEGKLVYSLGYSNIGGERRGYTEVIYDYDDKGDLIGQTSFDEQSNLVKFIKCDNTPLGRINSLYQQNNLKTPYRLHINTNAGFTSLEVDQDTGIVTDQSGFSATNKVWKGKHYEDVLERFLDSPDDFQGKRPNDKTFWTGSSTQ